jgi:hypothetical protein
MPSPMLTLEVSIMRRIIANPEILGGKPIVEGTRLSVDHILTLLVNSLGHRSCPRLLRDRASVAQSVPGDVLCHR